MVAEGTGLDEKRKRKHRCFNHSQNFGQKMLKFKKIEIFLKFQKRPTFTLQLQK